MKIKKLVLALSWITTVLFLPLANFMPVAAASASMSLSLSGSPAVGNNISIIVRENSGSEPVNAARATLSYPSNLLQFLSISSSSAFSIVAASSGGGGSVTLDRGALPSVSGSQTMASINFRVLKDSGTAILAFTSGSVISANSNSDIAAGKSGVSFALKAQPPAPVKDTTPPKISAVVVSDLNISSATISWVTSEPATSEIDYGPTQSYGLAAADTSAVTAHKLVLNSPLIQPGVTYHYIIKSTDPSGNAASTADSTFTIQGATLALTVIDQSKHPLSGAKVEFDNQTASTDKNGLATVHGVTLGKKTGVITYRGDKYPFSANITSADKPNVATAQITVKPNYTLAALIFILLLLIVDFLIGLRTGRGGIVPSGLRRLWDKLPFGGSSSGPPAEPPAGPTIQGGGQGPTIHPGGTA